jgi:acylphosphatase
MNQTQRREVHYSGRVQGVGFRQTTVRIAERFTVTGFAENLPDGRVRLIVEGEPAEIDLFLAAVQDGLERYIRDIDERHRPATGEFGGFGIRR